MKKLLTIIAACLIPGGFIILAFVILFRWYVKKIEGKENGNI